MDEILKSDIFLINRTYKNLFCTKVFDVTIREIYGQELRTNISSFQLNANIVFLDHNKNKYFSIRQKIFSKSGNEFCIMDRSGQELGFIKEYFFQGQKEDLKIEDVQHREVAKIKFISDHSLDYKNRSKVILSIFSNNADLGVLSIEYGFVYYRAMIDLCNDKERIIDRRIAISLAVISEDITERLKSS